MLKNLKNFNTLAGYVKTFNMYGEPLPTWIGKKFGRPVAYSRDTIGGL